MLFGRALVIDSSLPASVTRALVRAFSASDEIPNLEDFRRRQIIGWRLSEANESFLFQPEYGDSLNVEGARFVGLIEPIGTGSRIRGRVMLSPLMKIVMGGLMLAVASATVVALAQGRESPARVLAIGSLMLGVAMGMARYSLASTRRLVETRLRQSLDQGNARAVA